MKPTEYDTYNIEDDHGPVVRPSVFLQELEQQNFELVKPIEGMCYVDGKWQRLLGVMTDHTHDGQITARSKSVFRLIPLEQL